jgi:SNF2 family DNA or RNA helicase
MIRRIKSQVLKDLPEKTRKSILVDLEGRVQSEIKKFVSGKAEKELYSFLEQAGRRQGEVIDPEEEAHKLFIGTSIGMMTSY